jgi:hypothetical protein
MDILSHWFCSPFWGFAVTSSGFANAGGTGVHLAEAASARLLMNRQITAGKPKTARMGMTKPRWLIMSLLIGKQG